MRLLGGSTECVVVDAFSSTDIGFELETLRKEVLLGGICGGS